LELVDSLLTHFKAQVLRVVLDGDDVEVSGTLYIKGNDGEATIPTTPLFLTFRFSALTMREIRLVITPLDPGHEGQALLNRIGMQGQHDFEEPAEL
jgi:hypothetical protein